MNEQSIRMWAYEQSRLLARKENGVSRPLTMTETIDQANALMAWVQTGTMGGWELSDGGLSA